MEREQADDEHASNVTGRRSSGTRTTLAGVEVRDEDLEPQVGLHFIGIVFRVSSIVILLLALWQFADWWLDRPPGDVGLAVLVSDTIRLIVVAALLWAASNLADLLVKSHYDIRAGRILLARQTYMMQQMGIANGTLPATPPDTDRRGLTAEQSIPPSRRTPPER
jgi:hypothetical protein